MLKKTILFLSYDSGFFYAWLDDDSGSSAVFCCQVNDLLRGLMQQLIRRGLIALHDIENVLRFFVHFGLFHLADLQTAEHLIGVVTVTVFVRRNRHRLRLADGHKAFAAVGEAQGDISIHPVDVVGAEGQLALQGDQVIDIHRLVDVEHAVILLEKLNEVLAGGDVLAALDPGLVMQDVEALQDRIGVDVQLRILLKQRFQALVAVYGPFRILAVIVETADLCEHNLDPRVQYGLFYIEFHVSPPVM